MDNPQKKTPTWAEINAIQLETLALLKATLMEANLMLKQIEDEKEE